MSLKWYCKGKTKDYGPFTFQDLVKLIRAGKLTEEHYVKREYATRWERVRDVIGLLEVAARPVVEAETEEQDDSTNETAPAGTTADAALAGLRQAASTLHETYHPPEKRRLVTRRRVAAASVMMVVLVSTTALVLRARENRRFPQSAADEGLQSEYTLELLRCPSPESPSIPGLVILEPAPVLGLEEVGDIYSLCLSPDLKTLVFCGADGIDQTHDVYITTRRSLLDPFGECVRIDACSSDTWEINPCLSADGLELYFTRPAKRDHFWRSTRSSANDEFGPPEPWPKRGFDGTRFQVGRARLMDANRLIFNGEAEGERHFIFMASREKPGRPFGVPKLTYLLLTEARSMVSADGMRSYFGTTAGLFLSGRRLEKEGFSRGFEILGADVTGPVETPIWITPQEDVIFYLSPGPGQEPGTARKAWMVRI